MYTHEIEAKSILRKYKKLDSWFVARYGMNFYRGCEHNCVYCDGRDEKYRVEGEFGQEVTVKINALNILRRELDPSRRRKPMPRGFMLPGGGVGDSYQPLEEKYQLTRGALKIMLEFGWPVHILTKSTLVERDLDLLLQLNRQQRVIVSFSFSSVSDKASAVFEPGVPPPSERLATISRLRAAGITCGMYLMPVIPFITDTPIQMDRTIRKAKEAGVRFIVFGGMTLKEGRQKD
ncbi:radical SAM protein, partial [bacterium]|nr:radical SAM protein [bacterium]